ncbi:hypothetical protein VTO42DRAFT_6448 [Malbranchea cinnamomea]
MNRYRNIPGLRPFTKATPTTICQKCLQKGHYSYECKVSTQDRPYRSRPSRTQQLANPKLQPQLTTEVPEDLLKPKGVADKRPTPKTKERGRKREAIDDLESDAPPGSSRKRARSISSHSSSSVSTISTGRSRSPTPPARRDVSRSPYRSGNRKRRMSESSSNESYFSDHHSEDNRTRSGRPRSRERYTRRRRKSRSPNERGRRSNADRRGSWRTRSRSESMDRSRIAKGRRSLTPYTVEERNASRSPVRRESIDGDLSPGRRGVESPELSRHDQDISRRRTPPPRHRSLSPYSKRLALTQALGMSR